MVRTLQRHCKGNGKEIERKRKPFPSSIIITVMHLTSGYLAGISVPVGCPKCLLAMQKSNPRRRVARAKAIQQKLQISRCISVHKARSNCRPSRGKKKTALHKVSSICSGGRPAYLEKFMVWYFLNKYTLYIAEIFQINQFLRNTFTPSNIE